jgi:hypothetical protein
VGTDAMTGEAAFIKRGYIVHLANLDKIRMLDAGICRLLTQLRVRARPRVFSGIQPTADSFHLGMCSGSVET